MASRPRFLVDKPSDIVWRVYDRIESRMVFHGTPQQAQEYCDYLNTHHGDLNGRL